MKKFFTLFCLSALFGIGAANAYEITLNFSGTDGDNAYQGVEVWKDYPQDQIGGTQANPTSNTAVYDVRNVYVYAKEGYTVSITSPTEGVLDQKGRTSNNYFCNEGDYWYINLSISDASAAAVFDVVVTAEGEGSGDENPTPAEPNYITVNLNAYNPALTDDDNPGSDAVYGVFSSVSFLGATYPVTDGSCSITYGENYTGEASVLTANVNAGYEAKSVTGFYKTSENGMTMSLYPAPTISDGVLVVTIPVNAYSVDIDVAVEEKAVTPATYIMVNLDCMDSEYLRYYDVFSEVSFLGEAYPVESNYASITYGSNYHGSVATASAVVAKGYKVESVSGNYRTPDSGFSSTTMAPAPSVVDGVLYFEVPVDATSINLSIVVSKDTTTGVNEIAVDAADAVIYNLNGVRVEKNNLTKGIYIVNGKKISVK